MRTITNKVTQQLGSEPVIVLKIDWAGGTKYYADKSLTFGSFETEGGIIELSGLVNVSKENTGESSTISVVLDDTDGCMKSRIDGEIIEGVSVTVYQYYELDEETNTIFIGKIAGDISWSEGERTLSITVESKVQDQNLGFTPTEDVTSDFVGNMMQLCFGTPIKVPCKRILKVPSDTLKYAINSNASVIEFESGVDFPQDTEISIEIKGIRYIGSLSGSTFTATTSNAPIYEDVEVDDRVVGDDYDNPGILWIKDTTIDLVGKYCYITVSGKKYVNYCTSQDGARCVFAHAWYNFVDTSIELFETELFGDGATMEVAGYPRSSWGLDYQYWLWNVLSWRSGFSRDIPEGSKIKQVVDYVDTYLVSGISATSIKEVLAYRTLKDKRFLAQVPSSYYTKQLSKSLLGQTCCVLEFPTALEEHNEDYVITSSSKKITTQGESWEVDTLYVTPVSSQGPCASDIIKWIIETYTDYTCDTTSFNAVKTRLDNYPCDFVLTDQTTAVEAAEDIAWQAMCAIYVRNFVVYIKDLTAEPVSASWTIDEDDVKLGSLSLGFVKTEDIYTKIKANWKVDYSDRDKSARTYIFENNTALYGSRELERDIYVYNREVLVKIVAGFWGYRYSNSWRHARFITPLEGMKLELYDDIALSLLVVKNTGALRGIVVSSNIGNDFSVSLEVELISKAGSLDEDEAYWTGDSNNPVVADPDTDDPSTGLTERDYEPTRDSDVDSYGSDPEKKRRFLKATIPYNAVRAEDFQLVIQIYNADGSKVSETLEVFLTLHSSDINDVLSSTTVVVTNGVFTGNLQVSGGSGIDNFYIRCLPILDSSIMQESNTNACQIAESDGTITATGPGSMLRDVASPFVVTGPANESVTIAICANINDGEAVSPTSITLDSSGNWTGNITISGGDESGDKVVHIYFGYVDSEEVPHSAIVSVNLSDAESGAAYNILGGLGITVDNDDAAQTSTIKLDPVKIDASSSFTVASDKILVTVGGIPKLITLATLLGAISGGSSGTRLLQISSGAITWEEIGDCE